MTLAFAFPGQGSQSVGMLNELASTYPQVREVFAEASAKLDYDLWQVVTDGPEARLNQTDVTQPAMLAAGVSVWRVWQAQGGAQPVLLAGHSLGEYTALVCAGALTFADAVALVAERGRLMQAAVPAGSGAMAAILGLNDDQVRQVCADATTDGVVEAVNFNSPGQVVVAGQQAAVERAMVLAKETGAKRVVALPVSAPSHCALMKPAAEQLAARLTEIHFESPKIPVLHNCDVTSHAGADDIRQALARQLYMPVRWVEIVRAMADQGVDRLIECGPGKVLAALTKRIDRTVEGRAVYDPVSLQTALN